MAEVAHVCGTGGFAGPLAGDPSSPLGLSAVGRYGYIELTWQMPNLNPGAVSCTVIYRSSLPQFSTATVLVMAGGNRYADPHGDNDLGTYHYWIRTLSIHGTPGELVGPASAAALPSIDQVLAGLAARIDAGFLATSLRAEIDRIGTLDLALAQKELDRLRDNEALSAALAEVTGELATAKTLIQDEVIARTQGHTALVASLNTLAAGVGENAAAIVVERNARTTALDAVAQQFVTLTAQTSSNTSAIQNEQTARVNADNALSQSITTLESTMGSNLAQAQQQLQTKIDTTNGKVTAIGSLYTVKLNANGLVGGFGVYNDGSTVEAGFDVDTFWIGSTGQNKKKPFIIQNGTVYIDSAVISKISANQIDARGLEVLDTNGNVLLGSGKGIPAAYLPGLGINLIPNSDFSKCQQGPWGTGTEDRGGWRYAGNDLTPVDSIGVNPGVNWNLSGGHTLYLHQPGRVGDSQGYAEISTTGFIPVTPGGRYALSAYTGAHRCSVVLFAYFYKPDGSYASQGFGLWSSNDEEGNGGNNLTGYKRQFAIAEIPADAALIRVVLRKYDTRAGYTDSWLFATMAQLEPVGGLAQSPGPWVNGGQTEIQENNVSTWIKGAAIGSAQIKYAAIGSAHIQQASINTAHIQSLSVDTLWLANESVSSNFFDTQSTGNGAITTIPVYMKSAGILGVITTVGTKTTWAVGGKWKYHFYLGIDSQWDETLDIDSMDGFNMPPTGLCLNRSKYVNAGWHNIYIYSWIEGGFGGTLGADAYHARSIVFRSYR